MRPVDRPAAYAFDAVFGGETTQQFIFEKTALPLVDAALGGINVTFMTYGQTGSGKTFTMTGTRDEPGITPRVVDAIFKAIEAAPDTSEFTLRVAYMEIYMERVRDLLNPVSTNLNIRQDAVRGIWIEGASQQAGGAGMAQIQKSATSAAAAHSPLLQAPSKSTWARPRSCCKSCALATPTAWSARRA